MNIGRGTHREPGRFSLQAMAQGLRWSISFSPLVLLTAHYLPAPTLNRLLMTAAILAVIGTIIHVLHLARSGYDQSGIS